jgi:hypothetical protein
MATPGLSEIITTTLRNRSGETSDNVSKGNALLSTLKEQGSWKAVSGRTIVRELDYQEGRFQWYSGYDVLDVSPIEVITAAEFNWAQAAGVVSASGLEIDVQNMGKEQSIDLWEARIKNAQRTMRNQITFGTYSNGTAFSGKIIGGLQLLVADDPTTGIVGGINRGTAGGTFWRNQFYRSTADGGASLSATTIQAHLDQLTLRCTRGVDKPNVYIADRVAYGYFWNSLQAIQRITSPSTSKAGAGFKALDFAGQPFYYEDSTGIPTEHVYALNTDFLEFDYASKRNFTPLPEDRAFNQDAFIQLILWAGQLVTTNASLQGVLYDNA